jgi:hypothetical protein
MLWQEKKTETKFQLIFDPLTINEVACGIGVSRRCKVLVKGDINKVVFNLYNSIRGVDNRRARTGRGLADADWRTRTARVSTAYINSKRKDIQT